VPKYDYRCTACGHMYEKRESFDAPSLQACPTCHGPARRVFTAPAIVFKGSGWYKTDSRGPEPSAVTAGTDGASAGKDKAATATADTAVSEAAAAD
jgi:putative FmdB family regulatory protein